MRLLLVPATFLAALAVRGRGLWDLPPTAGEATDAWRGLLTIVGPFGENFEAGRGVSAAASALALAVLVVAFLRLDTTRFGTYRAAAIAALALFDPLGLVAGREAGPGALLQLAGASLVFLALAPPRSAGARAGVSLLIAALLVGAWPADPSPVRALPPDAVITAWAGFLGPWPGGALLLLHHLGYALVPLAATALDRRPAGRLLAVALAGLLAAIIVDGGAPIRLTSFAAVSPPVLALVGLALERVSGRPAPGRTLAGIVLLVAAVNGPVFVSDLRSAQRFPWPIALKQLPPEEGALWTTVPEPLRSDTDREIRALPAEDDALAALLDAGGLTILVPVEGGRAWGARTDDLLATLERRRLATFEVRIRRFDLYRFELRAFIFPPRP